MPILTTAIIPQTHTEDHSSNTYEMHLLHLCTGAANASRAPSCTNVISVPAVVYNVVTVKQCTYSVLLLPVDNMSFQKKCKVTKII